MLTKYSIYLSYFLAPIQLDRAMRLVWATKCNVGWALKSQSMNKLLATPPPLTCWGRRRGISDGTSFTAWVPE